MKTTPIPVRLPDDLQKEIKDAADFTGFSEQEVMRLSMRIGLIDLRSSKDIAGIIQEIATDKGQSFLAWAREQAGGAKTQTSQQFSDAAAAVSPSTTSAGHPLAKKTANIAKFPRPTMPESEQKAAQEPPPYAFTNRKAK